MKSAHTTVYSALHKHCNETEASDVIIRAFLYHLSILKSFHGHSILLRNLLAHAGQGNVDTWIGELHLELEYSETCRSENDTLNQNYPKLFVGKMARHGQSQLDLQ